jgi:chloramphenicol 3-O-phosphotransferase
MCGSPRLLAIARAGNMVVIDNVLENEPPWMESLLELLEGIPVIFVGVHCPLGELERRERQRRDRKTGVAGLTDEGGRKVTRSSFAVFAGCGIISPAGLES